jgi:hypothetical protein
MLLLTRDLEVTLMKTTHNLDEFDSTLCFALGVALLLIAWYYGWTAIGVSALVLGLAALASSFIDWSLPRRTHDSTPVRHSHLGHDVHDRAHEGHPIDTESL